MDLPTAEQFLSEQDPVLANLIAAQQARWPSRPTEDPIWGLLRIVMAQQISTTAACRIATQVKSRYPNLLSELPSSIPDRESLRGLGLASRRADCCITIMRKSAEIRARILEGAPWEQAVAGIKGIGPWTLSVFRIMILRYPDELPSGDLGLKRAIMKVYGNTSNIVSLGEKWRPYRSVACWHLWRTLGNEQLG